MQIEIHNFRGIEKAELDVAPVALILGNNRAGKTSIARAVAAALTRTAVPYDLTKKDCGVMVREGAAKGSVTISHENGSATVEWKKRGDAEVYSVGDAPTASPVAAGLVDPLLLPPKELGALLIKSIKAEVTEKDLRGALEEVGQGSALTPVWSVISKEGWDLALKQAKETGSRLKGAWEAVTGEKFGALKVKDWMPEEFNGAVPSDDLDKLRAKVDAAQSGVDSAMRNVGASDSKRQALASQAEAIEELEAQVPELEALKDKAKADYDEIEAEFMATPQPSAAGDMKTVECPECKAALTVTSAGGGNYKLNTPEVVDQAKLKQARLDYASLSGRRENLRDKAGNLRRDLDALTDKLTAARKAKEDLAALPQGKEGADAALTTAQKKLDDARKLFNAADKYAKAKAAAEKVEANQAIVGVLDEAGLRRKKLTESMDSFLSGFLHPVCESLALPPMTVTDDMRILVGDTSYLMLSGSEQYRARAALQLALARVDGSQAVVLDAADVIVNSSDRAALLKAVVATGIKAIVCMAFKDAGNAPNLGKSGHGLTYWVENATAEVFTSQAEAA